MKDSNGVEVKEGDWIRCSPNDFIPLTVDKEDGILFVTTYHATLDLEYCYPFYKCEPCKAEKCCNDFGRTRCTHQNLRKPYADS